MLEEVGLITAKLDESRQTLMKTVFLWSTITDISESESEELKVLLNPAEIERAERLKFEQVRQRFIAGRAFLRTVLGIHLQRKPESIVLQIEKHGKPFLDNEMGRSTQFSFSRTDGWAACAVVEDGMIGVDLEQSKSLADMENLARTIFDESDWAIWDSQSTSRRQETFYRAWTRKEAKGKADGTGISSGPRNIRVPIQELPDGHSFLLRGSESHQWVMSDWSPANCISGSVVFEATGESTKPWTYRDQTVRPGSLLDSDLESQRVPDGMTLVIRKFHHSE